MAGRIPQQFIDELLDRTDIVDIIESRVPLRKAGRDFQGLCPFHSEKTPSFTVSQIKQFYHCFGCGAHGTAISFLMDYERMDFIDAVKSLAHHCGLPLPHIEQRDAAATDNREKLIHTLGDAVRYYRQQLRDHPAGKAAIAYLKKRGMDGATAAEYGVGFAPPGWDNLTQALGRTPEKLDQLITTGMVTRNEQGRCYDRFRNRIVFPIRNRRGQVIGFGGRIIDDQDSPKYLNSPESPLFHKGSELYGLFEARQALRHIDQLLVVEGYMDVISLAQRGIRNAVATLGTALTEAHLSPLFRATHHVVFCFDGDRAGRAAAWKALDIVLPALNEGRRASFMFLPDGEDPDSLVSTLGADGFNQHITNATPLSEFLFDALAENADLKTLDGRSRLLELAQTKVAKIRNPVYRTMLVNTLGQRLRLHEEELRQITRRSSQSPRDTPTPPARHQAPARRRLSPVRNALTLLLNDLTLAQRVENPQQYLELQEPGIALLVEVLKLAQSRPNTRCANLIEHWRGQPEFDQLAKLADADIAITGDNIGPEFDGILNLLERQLIEQETANLLRKEQTHGLESAEKSRLAQLLVAKHHNRQ